MLPIPVLSKAYGLSETVFSLVNPNASILAENPLVNGQILLRTLKATTVDSNY